MAITDLSYLKDYSGGDNEFMVEMIELFLDNTPGFLDEMESALKMGEFETVGKIAHKIKPSMTFMGVENGKEKALELEEMGKSPNPDQNDLEKAVSDFKSLCENAFEELKTSLSELKS